MIDSLNETYLFFAFSPKRQRFFERVLEIFGSHSNIKSWKDFAKHDGLSDIHATRHSMNFLPLCASQWKRYWILIHMWMLIYTKDDIVENWSWDRETRVKYQGLVKCLKSTEYIIAFLVANNFLEMVKRLASKLQKRDQDIFQVYTMIDNVINDINETRQNIDDEFKEIFEDVEGCRIKTLPWHNCSTSSPTQHREQLTTRVL